MSREELIKEVINLTFEQVVNKGWDLIDLYNGFPKQREEAIEMVYREIKDEI